MVYRATSLWTTAEISKPAAPGNQAAGSLATKPAAVTQPGSLGSPGRTETYAPAPLPDSAQIVNYYNELERAVESRQLGEVKRLLPNMSESEDRAWRSLFEDKDVDRISATFRVQAVNRRDGLKAYARVYQEIRTAKGNSALQTKRQGLEYAELTLGPQGWRQISSERVKQ